MRDAGPIGGLLPAKRLSLPFIHNYLLAAPAAPVAPTYPYLATTLTFFPWYGNGPDPQNTVTPQPVRDCLWAAREDYRRIKANAYGLTETWPPTAAVVTEYLAYNNGQDVAACIADVLLAWYKAGTIVAFAPVDHTNPAAVDTAATLFHGVLCGVTLTNDADHLFSQGNPWTVANGETPAGGDSHCIIKVGSDGTSTDKWACWNAIQESTTQWTEKCLTEAWVVVTAEDANQLDMTSLIADIDALGGTAPTQP